jgi:hypothetical protein
MAYDEVLAGRVRDQLAAEGPTTPSPDRTLDRST